MGIYQLHYLLWLLPVIGVFSYVIHPETYHKLAFGRCIIFRTSKNDYTLIIVCHLHYQVCRDGELYQMTALDFFATSVVPMKEPPIVTTNYFY